MPPAPIHPLLSRHLATKIFFLQFLESLNIKIYPYLREALGNKTLVLLQRARRASTPSPLGRVVECGGWISRGLWVMFSTGVAKSLFVVPWNPFRSLHGDFANRQVTTIPTRQRTSHYSTNWTTNHLTTVRTWQQTTRQRTKSSASKLTTHTNWLQSKLTPPTKTNSHMWKFTTAKAFDWIKLFLRRFYMLIFKLK